MLRYWALVHRHGVYASMGASSRHGGYEPLALLLQEAFSHRMTADLLAQRLHHGDPMGSAKSELNSLLAAVQVRGRSRYMRSCHTGPGKVLLH